MRNYMVNYHLRHSYIPRIHKMRDKYIAQNIYEIAIETLKKIGCIDYLMIKFFFIYVGLDGESYMQRKRNGVCVKVKLVTSPFMKSSIHFISKED